MRVAKCSFYVGPYDPREPFDIERQGVKAGNTKDHASEVPERAISWPGDDSFVSWELGEWSL